ncbi:MAG: TetR/AcrR family transcriptional regulator [Candidatus Acidiferrales bacterium]
MQAKKKRIPSADRRKQILAVARRLFSQKGFTGVTTREIADKAGMNEAILFRHFRGKDALYWAVIEEISRAVNSKQELLGTIAKRQAAASDEDFFTSIAEGILERAARRPALIRLLYFCALERHTLYRRFFRTYVTGSWDVLAKYIRAGMRAGDFRKVNPMLAARSFTGMVGHFYVMQNLFGAKEFQRYNDRAVCRTLAQIWLQGMQRGRASRSSTK